MTIDSPSFSASNGWSNLLSFPKWTTFLPLIGWIPQLLLPPCGSYVAITNTHLCELTKFLDFTLVPHEPFWGWLKPLPAPKRRSNWNTRVPICFPAAVRSSASNARLVNEGDLPTTCLEVETCSCYIWEWKLGCFTGGGISERGNVGVSLARLSLEVETWLFHRLC